MSRSFLTLIYTTVILTLFPVQQGTAFEMNMTKGEVAKLLGKTFVKDLVIGDRAYIMAYFVCWEKSGLSIDSEATVTQLSKVAWSNVGYTFLVESAPGGMLDLSTIEDRVKESEPDSISAMLEEVQKEGWASSLAEILISQNDCTDRLDRNASLTFSPIGTINGHEDYKAWFFETLKKNGELKE